jgi:murein DD-endopeptidase MepM/ murein hydrolase activator NlpD
LIEKSKRIENITSDLDQSCWYSIRPALTPSRASDTLASLIFKSFGHRTMNLTRATTRVFLLSFFLCASAWSEQDVVRVSDARLDAMSYAVRADYQPAVRGPVTLTVRLTLANMISSAPEPATVVLRNAGVRDLMRLRRADMESRWSFHYDWHWMYGDRDARHSDNSTYRLPLSFGVRSRVTQAFHGRFSHRGNEAYAVDFDLPEGTPVCAARKGWVVATRNDVTTNVREKPPGSADGVPANHVVILHEDGTVGWYLHFRPGGVLTRIGRFVRDGDIVGLSGNTGLSQTPHLHFEVYKPADGYTRQTVPIRFAVKGRTDAVELQEGRVYEAR